MHDIHDPNYELKDVRTKIERLYAPYPRSMRFVGDPPNPDRGNTLIDKFIAATRAEICESSKYPARRSIPLR
jgi:hypothetical protein